MIVSSNYYPKIKRPGCAELKRIDTYTEDLHILTQPLEQLGDFFELLLKAEDYDDIAFIGKALVEQAVMRTEEYIKVLEHEFGDVRFFCAMDKNEARIPGGALVKVEIAKEQAVAA